MVSLQEKTMNKQDKVHYVIETLEGLYPKTPIPLDHKDPYTLLIAVLLSAQCTDKRVNKITPKLFKIADTAEKMIKISISDIEDIIRPCGLSPMKSKGIYGLSKMIIEKHNGKVPNNFKDLEEFIQLHGSESGKTQFYEFRGLLRPFNQKLVW